MGLRRLAGITALLAACSASPGSTTEGSGNSVVPTGGSDTSSDGALASSGQSDPAGSTSSGTPEASTGDTSAGSSGAGSSTGPALPSTCEVTTQSVCDNDASIIRGEVRLAPEMQAAEGDLVVALLHRRYGSPDVGGHPHAVTRRPGISLGPDEPFAFEIDMCDANATMWSEENCEYNLVVWLDTNGNNGFGPGSIVPDVDEPTVMHVFNLSCHAEGPTCLQLELGCTGGQDCLSFEAAPACECSADACDSEAAICKL